MEKKLNRGLRGLQGKKGEHGEQGERGEKGDHGQDGRNGKNADESVIRDITYQLGSIERALVENDRVHEIIQVKLKEMEDRRDAQHREMMEAFNNVSGQLKPLDEMLTRHDAMIEMNTRRLLSLVDTKDGSVPKLQQDVAMVKTKSGMIAGMVSILVSTILGVAYWLFQHITK